MALFLPDSVNLSGGRDPEREAALRVSAGLPGAIGLRVNPGRLFAAEEYVAGKDSVVLRNLA